MGSFPGRTSVAETVLSEPFFWVISATADSPLRSDEFQQSQNEIKRCLCSSSDTNNLNTLEGFA